MLRFALSLLLFAWPALGCDASASANATNAVSSGHTPGSTNAAHADDVAIDLAVSLGADLLYWWQPSAETVSLNGSNISALNERVAGANAVQASAGNQPRYEATAGPNGKPCVDLAAAGLGTDNHLIATISIPAANRVGIYVVSRPGTVNGAIQYTGGGTSRVSRGAGGEHSHMLAFTGGSQTILLSSPALVDTWHLHALLPLATGASSRINGVTTTPNFTGTDTRIGQTQAFIGHPSVSGGQLALLLMVNMANDPVHANTIVERYVFQEFRVSP